MARHAMLFGVAAVGALLAANPALSATPLASFDAQQEFRIPSQSLDTALLLYSRQSGLQIISSAPAVSNKTVLALGGVMTPRQALANLLKGSNLTFVVSGGTVTIVPVSAARGAALLPAALSTNDAVQAGPFNAPSPTTEPSQAQQDAPIAAPPPANESQAPTVTVTGSRIVRNGYSAPTPVTVATVADLLETTPTDIADALNKLPEFSPQFTQQSNTGAAAPAGNYLNLRGLGQNRTLVLMDGLRVPATNTTGTVDVNTLPQALVQRVEVVTGGASAIYGSDAVGGVVNYILDTKFIGFKASAQTGISTYGDAPSDKFTVAFGTHVTDNGHFEVSYEHAVSAGINQSDRGYTSSTPGYAGAGTATNPYTLYENLRMATTTAGGYIQSGPASLTGQQFLSNGTLAPFHAGAATGTLPTTTAGVTTGGLQVGGDGAYITGGQLVKPVDTDNLFARFDYDIVPGITAYAQVAAGLSQTNYLIQPTALSTTVLSGNPYLPAAAQTALTSAKAASFTMASLPQNLFNMQQTNEWDSNLSGVFGLKGKLFNDTYSWNLSYTHGQGLNHVETDNNINTAHFYAALDAVTPAGGGSPVCYISTTSNASLYPGCVPLNFIGQGNESAAALAYIMQNTAYTINNQLDDMSASISGTAFNDWAGPVSISANAEARWVSLQETTDAPPNAINLAATGLRQTWTTSGLKGAAPTTPFLGTTTAAQYGADSVWEVGGETVVPLLKDFPAIKNLEFSGALRYTQYSISGPAITWKAGLNYQPVDDLRIRVTESRDIRAPTLYELFQAPTVSQVTITDPAANNQTYTVSEYSGGNPNVKPEVATTNTLGFVYSPSWFPRFRISTDYYLITIVNGISNSLPAIGTAGILDDINTCAASGGTSIYCQAIPRGANGLITQVNSFNLNLAEQYTRGYDVEASYSFDMSDIHAGLVGHTDLRFLGTYSPTNVTIASPGASPAGSPLSDPIVPRATVSASYSLGPVKVSWQSNITAAYRIPNLSLSPVFFTQPTQPATVTDDLGVSYRFKAQGQNLQAFFNVTNLFNQTPQLVTGPTVPTATPGAATPLNANISPLGRYFTAGVRIGF